MTTLEIPEDLDERLEALAERFQVSKEEFTLRALEEAVVELENSLGAVESSEASLWKSVQRLSLEELEEKLGLEPELDFDEETVH